MMKRVWFCMLLAVLLTALTLSVVSGETRETVIEREGMAETVTETRIKGGGFSLWYAREWLEAFEGERDNMYGVIVQNRHSPDDWMIVCEIPEEDAIDYTDDYDGDIVKESASSRIVMDIYRVLEEGKYLFLSLVADHGRYVSVVGEYAQEAAEGTGVLLQRALESVTFEPGAAIAAAWGEEDEEAEAEGKARVILTALAPIKDVRLVRIEWEDMTAETEGLPAYSLETVQTWAAVQPGEQLTVTLEFVGELPNNGVAYMDEEGDHIYALDMSGEDGSLYLWQPNLDSEG